ncbi:MAG: minor capsid protein [Thomasclavelia ramosa]|nr:minor capsid protein [Thomasclavelia ramosa]
MPINKKSAEYWAKRFELLESAMHDKSTDTLKEIERLYNKAIKETDKDIRAWYQRFADNEGISFAEAQKVLQKGELKAFKMDVEEYIEKGKTLQYSQKWASELERASARVHVSRLEALKFQMQQHVEELTAKKSDKITNLMKDVYKDSYYRGLFEINKGVGIGSTFAKINKDQIEKVIFKPWTADGSNFSEKIWGKHRPELVKKLHDGLTLNLIHGKSPDELVKKLSKDFEVDKHRIKTLVYTEQAYFQSLATREMYEKMGVEKYEVNATMDHRTSQLCREMDGKVFETKDYMPGVTANPFHPNCRTTTTPYIDDEFEQGMEKLVKNENGSYYTVPANMKYDEWYRGFVEGDKNTLDKYNLTKNIATVSTIKKIMSSQLNQLTKNERLVLTKMTGALSNNINYRIGNGGRLDKFADQIALIDSALDKGVVPEEINLIRKTIPEYLFPGIEKIDLAFLQSQIGRIIENPIYSSTSFIDFNYPLRNLVIHLKVPKGYRGALYIRDIAYDTYKKQDEVLFKRGLKYIITDVKIKDGKYVMYAEVIE